MTDSGDLIVDTTTRIFQDIANPQTVNIATSGDWRAELWSALEAMGLTRTWVSDELGGAGASVMDAFEVLRVAGGFAVAVPLAETLLAGWALSGAGLETPLGQLTIVADEGAGAFPGAIRLGDDGRLTGQAPRVAFAREAHYLAVECRTGEQSSDVHVALVAADACCITPGDSLAKDPLDAVDLTGASPLTVGPRPAGAIGAFPMGAAVRAMQMAGALQTVLDISVQYSSERVAFERPIGKFQAVQHNLARLAGEVAAANASANSAAFALEHAASFDDALFIEIASAKIRVGEAANEGAMIGHQTHGAIGYTQEHILHRFTHRLWSWRDQFGDENYWASRLGAQIARTGADGLWPTLTRI